MRVKFTALAATVAVAVASGGVRGTVGDDAGVVDVGCGFGGIWDGGDDIGGYQRGCTVDDDINCGGNGRWISLLWW